jgi:hypothetical protein
VIPKNSKIAVKLNEIYGIPSSNSARISVENADGRSRVGLKLPSTILACTASVRELYWEFTVG